MVDSNSPVSGTVYDGVGKYMFIIDNYCVLNGSMHVFIDRSYMTVRPDIAHTFIYVAFVRSLIPIFL